MNKFSASFPRHRQPFEAPTDDAVHLQFNYWMQKPDIRAILPSEAQDMIVDILAAEKSPCLGVATNEENRKTDSLVIVVVNGLDSESLSDQCVDEAPFLAETSSIPIISVRKFQLPKANADGRMLTNPNLWFYNDVKSLESELLHTILPAVPVNQVHNLVINAESEKRLWNCSHSLVFQLRTTNPTSSTVDIKWLVFRPNSLGIEESNVLKEATISKLNDTLSLKDRLHNMKEGKDFNLSYTAGKILVTDIPIIMQSPISSETSAADFIYGPSMGKGFYFIDSKISENGVESINSIVLVWDSMALDVLYPVETEAADGITSDSLPSVATLKRFCSMNGKQTGDSERKKSLKENGADDENDILEMTLSHVFPLYPESVLPSSESEVPITLQQNNETMHSEDICNVLDEVKVTSSLLSEVKERFEGVAEFLHYLIICNDSLDILGYVCEDFVSIPEFVSTRQDNWILSLEDLKEIRSKASESDHVSDNKKKVLQTSATKVIKTTETSYILNKESANTSETRHIRFNSICKEEDLEEGEELEDGEEIENVAIVATEVIVEAEEIVIETTMPSLMDRINSQAASWLFRDIQLLNESKNNNMTDSSGISGRKRPRSPEDNESSHRWKTFLPLNIAAMDCEMCETVDGLELTRITILHPTLGVVLDTLVKPAKEIVNYHTEFSGITKEQLDTIDITLQDVQAVLRTLISRDTILVGHSFDNDLRAIRLFHDRIIDTSALFVHPSGYPYKFSLKKLTKDVLHWEIQDGADGHDSIQDAAATMLLAIAKAEEEKQILGQSSENANYLSTLKSVVGSKHYHQRYLSRNTVASAANLYSDIYAPTPRYSWFHHIHQSLPIQRLDGNAINGLQGRFRWHVVVHPPVPGAARWEREGLGYPAESDAIQALADVYFKTQNSWNLADQSNQFQFTKADSWKSAFAATITQLTQAQDVKDGSTGIHWLSVDVAKHLSNPNIALSLTSNNNAIEIDETENNSKRPRLTTHGGSPSHLDSNPHGLIENVSPLRQIDQQLQSLYEAMPANSKLVVLNQRSLIPLRILIAKKLRKRWDMQSANKKRVRVAMPKISGVNASEWDNQSDEARLLEEANAAARCCLFIRYKV